MDHEVISLGESADEHDVYHAVLLHEHQQLRRVTRVDDLYRWRDRLVAELARPESAYARAMIPPSSTAKQAHNTVQYAVFLSRWSTIVEEAIQRLQRQGTVANQQSPGDLATAILAAVRGGVLLARVTEDVGTLRNALRLPFDQLCPHRDKDASG